MTKICAFAVTCSFELRTYSVCVTGIWLNGDRFTHEHADNTPQKRTVKLMADGSFVVKGKEQHLQSLRVLFADVPTPTDTPEAESTTQDADSTTKHGHDDL